MSLGFMIYEHNYLPSILLSLCLENVDLKTVHKENTLICHLPVFRDLLLPDGNRVSAFSVASTAIAAAQWSSSQVGPFLLTSCCLSSPNVNLKEKAHNPNFTLSATAEFRGNV